MAAGGATVGAGVGVRMGEWWGGRVGWEGGGGGWGVAFEYVRFVRVFGRAAAVVHHGGIGTTSQCFRAGVPQLIMPMAHDQPDNAARVKRMGVGDYLYPK